MANISRFDAFQKALGDIDKSIGNRYKDTDSSLGVFGDKKIDVELISTGSLVLDSILGGGFPKGRLIEIYGPEASGKTSIALNAVGNVQRDGGTAVFIDLEHALDPRYATKLGVDMKSLGFAQPSSTEETMDMVKHMASSGVVDLIVIDSIAAMVPMVELEGSLQDQTIGVNARILSRALKNLAAVASKNGCTIIFINQVREKIGVMFGNPETTSGGKAMKFFASQRIRISKTGIQKDGKVEIGTEVKMKVVKNKINRPYLEATTVLTFNKGINLAAELAEIGPKLGVIERPSNVSWVDAETGEVFSKKGKAAAIKALEDDPDLFARISRQVYEAISEDDEVFEEDAVPLEEDSATSEDDDNDTN